MLTNYRKTASGYLMKYLRNSGTKSAGRPRFPYYFMDVERLYEAGHDFICCGFSCCVVLQFRSRSKVVDTAWVSTGGNSGIVQLLSKNFRGLILIAFVVAIPGAFYCMQRRLQGFVYRVKESWWIFLGAGMIAFIIAMITISVQTIKAAIANPVKSLRTE
ncbi:MAG: hypothetical protein ABI472_11825 [Ginsengibacter sp.]